MRAVCPITGIEYTLSIEGYTPATDTVRLPHPITDRTELVTRLASHSYRAALSPRDAALHALLLARLRGCIAPDAAPLLSLITEDDLTGGDLLHRLVHLTTAEWAHVPTLGPTASYASWAAATLHSLDSVADSREKSYRAMIEAEERITRTRQSPIRAWQLTMRRACPPAARTLRALIEQIATIPRETRGQIGSRLPAELATVWLRCLDLPYLPASSDLAATEGLAPAPRRSLRATLRERRA